MNPNERLFMAMDIPVEVRNLVSRTLKNATCEGMNGDEYLAYTMGINNTLSALRSVLEADDDIVIHVPNIDVATEFDINELTEMIGVDNYD